MRDLPTTAAWRHLDGRFGFEVVFSTRSGNEDRVEGASNGVEDGEAWWLTYALELDRDGRTRTARVTGRSAHGSQVVELTGDGEGLWRRDGAPAPHLDGCLDVDLEASAFTNALPVRRLGLGVGEQADAPAAWVRTLGLDVERLEQSYARVSDEGERHIYEYAAPALAFRARLVHDQRGVGIEYPGLAVRAL